MYPRFDTTVVDPQLISTTTEHLERYASEGLRTLVLAQRELDEKYYMEWSANYKQALSHLDDSATSEELKHVEALEEEMESKLILLGATAVEDRLQDDVPSTIASLSKAGIKIWILTGDKEETAINIAYACQLLNNDMERLIINLERFKTPERLKQVLDEKSKKLKLSAVNHILGNKETQFLNPPPKQAIVIDGQALAMVYKYPLLKFLFLEVAQQCTTVICCRVSPKQKAEVSRIMIPDLHIN